MPLNNCYVSCASNHTPSVAHWGKNNLICYGSCNAVLIYDPHISGGKILKSLSKHTGRVNSVKWISGKDHETELLSGSTDGTAIVWSLQSGEYVPYVLQGHDNIVNIVDGLYKDVCVEYAVVVTASVDSKVKVWTRQTKTAEFTQTQDINFGYNLCLYLKLTFLTCDTLLLVCTTDKSQIELYVDDNDNEIHFAKNETLKGHEDWVRGVDFIVDVNGGGLLLATSGQDHVIQLFRITEAKQVQFEKYSLKTSKRNYVVRVESVLTGHEGWIYSVNWSPTGLRLLSASIDKTLLIWEFDASVNLWLETARLGEVGGNTLGFYGAAFSPDGNSIMAHSYHGAFHIWNFSKDSNSWDPVVTVGGHFNEVTDLSWEPEGEFLISVSADQTTRIHAPWRANKDDEITWHEIARPQVHGYDINCLAVLSRYKFASGAEEKVIRVFQAPENFIRNFRRICHVDECNINGLEAIPRGASVPSLGLSNKAVYESNNDEEARPKSSKDPYPEESHFAAIDLESPPTEETLIQNTLWPEIQKLYGHGYEVFSLAATADGKILASACKATTVEHAAIILWDTSNWIPIQKLPSHTLTIAQMAFSPDTNHLLSVSRDRRWSLFSKSPELNKYELAATTDKKTGIHARIIWCCTWSHDSKYFGTGSRDGKVVIWYKNHEKSTSTSIGSYAAASEPLDVKGESVTALAFAPDFVGTQYLLAIGLESGYIHLYKWNDKKWSSVLIMDKELAHHLCVKRLAFRPKFGEAGSTDDEKSILQLASCSSDHSVKITNLDVRKL